MMTTEKGELMEKEKGNMADFDDFGLLAQMARRELIHLLESIPEVKDLAVELSLMRPLDKIASMSVLQEHNCAHVQQFLHHSNLKWSENAIHRLNRNEIIRLEHHEFTMATLVDHNFIHLRAVAKSLWQLQTLYGLIPIVYGIGENSIYVNKLMKKLHNEFAVRNMHMTAVFPFLSAKAKSLQASYDKGSNLEQVKDMKEFVSNELRTLKQQHKLLELHICACEVVLEKCKGISSRLTLEHALISGNFDPNEVLAYLEDCMCTQHNQWQILLLACLWSLTQNGIPTKYFNQFRNQYLYAFGHENLAILHFLGIQGLLIERSIPQLTTVHNVIPIKSQPVSSFSKPTFQFLTRRMALLPGNTETTINLRNPDQMRYVFSGVYTPILCKIVNDTINNGWNMEEMKITFGDTVFCDQNCSPNANRQTDNRIRKVILVYFIGGVTYSEIAALTLLAQYNNLRIIIATTNIIHREKFIKELANVSVTSFSEIEQKL
ncbi:Sec1 family protein [Brugia pahangi]